MSHATHVGFSAPLNSCGVTMVRSFFLAPLPPHLHSAAPPVPVTVVGVGHMFFRAIVCSDGLIFPTLPAAPPWLVPYEQADGVGSHNPDPVSTVRCAGMSSSQHSPSRIKPHLGQVSENSMKPPRSEHW